MPHLVRLVFSHLVSVLINPSVLTLPLPSSPLIVHLSFRLSILSYNPSQSASPLYSHMSSLHGFRCTSSRHSVHHGICRMSSITAPVVYYSIVIKGLWSFTHSSKVRHWPKSWKSGWTSGKVHPLFPILLSSVCHIVKGPENGADGQFLEVHPLFQRWQKARTALLSWSGPI